MGQLKRMGWILTLVFGLSGWLSSADVAFDRYHKPEEANAALKEWAEANSGFAKIHALSRSAGRREILLIEIGPETGKARKSLPAVFVAANMEGTTPIAVEAALFLTKLILEKPETRENLTWYILPCGNPDAAVKYFTSPLLEDARNATPHNDDMDDRTDEDGVDDLDGNGIITMMRVRDPEGEWMLVPGEPRLMKRADWSKGEKGVFKLYTEGLDDDRDGRFNEDGPGGVNVGVQFPHLFKFFTEDGGSWAGSEEESFAMMKFLNEHREIGLFFVFGRSNFCWSPPRGDRQGETDLSQIKIPEMYATAFGADPDKTYSMDEIMEMVQPLLPAGMEINESMIASFLGLGGAVNPLADDLKFYQELSEKFKEFLKANKLDGKRLAPSPDKDGSLELYAYYHLGIPSFSLDFWTLPEIQEEEKEEELTPEKLEAMSDDDFIALGEDKINTFLKSMGAPDQFSANQVIAAVKGGMMTTKRMAEMLRQMPKPPAEGGADPKEKALLAFSDTELEGKGFVDWKSFEHPTLGDVEIGGAVPFVENTPPAAKIIPLLEGQVPWVLEIAGKMARVKVGEVEVKPLGGGIHSLEAWIENTGYLPYPTAMGRRNARILPVVVSLDGKGYDVVDGKKRSLVQAIDGFKAQKVRWIIKAEKPVRVEIRASTENAWSDSKTIEVGGVR